MYFDNNFKNNLYKNTQIDADEKVLKYILRKCAEITPYKKIDNKGRKSAYYTFLIYDKLIIDNTVKSFRYILQNNTSYFIRKGAIFSWKNQLWF